MIQNIALTVFRSDGINCVVNVGGTPCIDLVRGGHPFKGMPRCPLLLKNGKVPFKGGADLIEQLDE